MNMSFIVRQTQFYPHQQTEALQQWKGNIWFSRLNLLGINS